MFFKKKKSPLTASQFTADGWAEEEKLKTFEPTAVAHYLAVNQVGLDFVPSWLIFARLKSTSHQKITSDKRPLLIKQNYLRKSRYQLQTQIVTTAKGKEVWKTPLQKAGAQHLKKIAKNYVIINQKLPNLELMPTKLLNSSPDGLRLMSHYCSAATLEKLMEEALIEADFTQILIYWKKYRRLIDDLPVTEISAMSENRLARTRVEFQTIFDPQQVTATAFNSESSILNLGLLDLIPTNLCFEGFNKNLKAFDQEWLEENKVPKNYLLFRAIFDLSQRLQGLIKNLCCQTWPSYQLHPTAPLLPRDWVQALDLEPTKLATYWFWEENWQNFIHQEEMSTTDEQRQWLAFRATLDHEPILVDHCQELTLGENFNNLLEANTKLASSVQDLKQRLTVEAKGPRSTWRRIWRISHHPVFYWRKKWVAEKLFRAEAGGWKAYGPRIKGALGRRRFIKKIDKLVEDTSTIKTISPKKIQKILIISGARGTVAEIHRIRHLEEKLKILKKSFITLDVRAIVHQDPTELLQNDCLYLHRVVSEPILDRLIMAFQKQYKKVIFDIDDLVFDQKALPAMIASQPQLTTTKIEIIRETAIKHLEVMKKADLIVTPTDFLALSAKKLTGKPTFILPNHLDKINYHAGLAIACARLSSKKTKKDAVNEKIVLGYFPGTATHQQDFAVCVPALQKILAEFPQVKLKIVGYLDLPVELEAYRSQIMQSDIVPYNQLMAAYQDVDINLAPLLTNDFCQAKSELKYFFAGIAGIPTLASPTKPFIQAINRSGGGLICTTERDWYQNLKKLILSPQERKKKGRLAYQDCRKFYSPLTQSKKLREMISEIQAEHR